MKIFSIREIEMRELSDRQFDICIAASGYETRSRFIPLSLGASASIKMAFAFTEKKDVVSRSQNDLKLRRAGYTLIETSGSDSKKVVDSVISVLDKCQDEDDLSILIDYSCMTRVWYGAVLNLLLRLPDTGKRIRVYFAYAFAEFGAPANDSPNLLMQPIPGFSQLTIPTREVALVIGLGYERDRAMGLREYIEPAETFAFFTEPALDKRFTREVRRNNKAFMEDLGPNRVFPYPMDSLAETDRLLSSLCSGLCLKYRVVLAPVGPKPFALLSMLLSTRLPNVDVWRVTAGEAETPYDRKPIGSISICQVIFERQKGRLGNSKVPAVGEAVSH